MRVSPLALVGVALQTLRTNPLHTLLSTLGLIIGVAALVAILALGDGLEHYARSQLAQTTDLHVVMVTSRTTQRIDGVPVRLDEPARLTLEDRTALAGRFPQSRFLMSQRQPVAVSLPDDTVRTAAFAEFTEPLLFEVQEAPLVAGRLFDADDAAAGRPVALVAASLAERLRPGAAPRALLGTSVLLGEQPFEVIGVLETNRPDAPPLVMAPIQAAPTDGSLPMLYAEAPTLEAVSQLRGDLEAWLDERFEAGRAGFALTTNQARLAQAQRGALVFKIIMGFIVGLSVLVGGIGIMNVLLMAVTERTREIGVRKATGARRGDVVLQFLTESVAIAGLGGLLGIAFGIAVVFAGAVVVRQMARVPFEPVLTASSVGLVFGVAVLIGILFGTYPAWRAASLEPVDAIRHE